MIGRGGWAIARKDMRSVGANLQVWLPMAIIPVILGVLLPAGMIWALQAFGDVDGMREIGQLIDRLPPSATRDRVAGLASFEQQAAYLFSNYLIAPLFLIIPLMTASVISADSFAGEKERGTLESLLFSPTAMRSLFAGKVLAAFLPAMFLSALTLALAAIAVNIAGWPLFARPFFPAVNWLPLMLLVIPSISLGAILLNVFISARVASFQAAYQTGGLVVLPVIALFAGQMSGVVLFDAGVVFGLGIVLTVIDAAGLAFFLRRLDRQSLFESQVRG